MRAKLDNGAILPRRAHIWDGGLDLFAREDGLVEAGGSCIFDTGIHVELPIGSVGILMSKSGLNVNHDITSEGVIDAGYSGSIKVKLYNHGKTDYLVRSGDKISQLLVIPILLPEVYPVDEIAGGDRGDGGFGSTGR